MALRKTRSTRQLRTFTPSAAMYRNTAGLTVRLATTRTAERPTPRGFPDNRAGGPGGQLGNGCVASAAGVHPGHRLFRQATPGPRHHTTTAASNPPPGSCPAGQLRHQGRAGHSWVAAAPAPAKPQVQVERPQRSEDERPGGAARQRPHPAARKATGQRSLGKRQRPKGTAQAAKRADGTLGTEAFDLALGVDPNLDDFKPDRTGRSARHRSHGFQPGRASNLLFGRHLQCNHRYNDRALRPAPTRLCAGA